MKSLAGLPRYRKEKNDMKKRRVFVLLLIIMMVTTCVLYPQLPNKIPSHWNFDGMIDGYQDSWFLFIPILIYFMVTVLFSFLRHVDPLHDNYARFQKTYDSMIIVLLFFIFSLWLIMAVSAFYPTWIDMNLVMHLLLSMLFVVLGNLMPKIKSNYFIGIRTPWTLTNESVWFKTHRMAGKLWFVGGFLMLPAIFLQNQASILYMIGMVILLGSIPCVYSYVIFQKMAHSTENEKG